MDIVPVSRVILRVWLSGFASCTASDRSSHSRSRHSYAESFAEGLAPAWITDGGKATAGYVDKSMQPVIRGDFRDPGPFSDGLADVAVADEWGVFKRGYIDRTGRVVVRRDTTRHFRSRTASVASA